MWDIITTNKFDEWFDCLNDADRTNVIAGMLLLREKGPHLSRPFADTVVGSEYSNMKELRIQSKGYPLRAFFAFDPERKGILLCAGNKVGDEKRFYKRMVPFADKEYRNHLSSIRGK